MYRSCVRGEDFFGEAKWSLEPLCSEKSDWTHGADIARVLGYETQPHQTKRHHTPQYAGSDNCTTSHEQCQHVMLCNHQQEFCSNPQTQSSIALAIFVEVGAVYETSMCVYCKGRPLSTHHPQNVQYSTATEYTLGAWGIIGHTESELLSIDLQHCDIPR